MSSVGTPPLPGEGGRDVRRVEQLGVVDEFGNHAADVFLGHEVRGAKRQRLVDVHGRKQLPGEQSDRVWPRRVSVQQVEIARR